MDSTPRSGARVLLVGVAAGGLAAAAFILGGTLGALLGAPVATLTAGLLLAGTPLLARVGAWAGVARPWAAAGLAEAPVAALLFGGAGYALGQPIVASHWRCGTGEMGLIMIAPFAFGLLGALGGLVAVAIAGRGAPRAGAALRAVALGSIGIAAALLAWSAARAVRLPGPDAYVASLPVMATLPPVSGAPRETVPRDDGSGLSEDVFVDRVPGLEFEVTRRCANEYCSYVLARAGAPEERTPDGKRIHVEGGSVPRTGTVTLRRDEAHRFWVVTGSSPDAYREDGEKLTLTDIHARDVGDALSPPPGWIAGAAGAALVAVVLEIRRRRARAALERVEAALAGALGEGGWITFEGEVPAVRAAPELELAPGPVLVLAPGGGKAPSGAYRGEAPLGVGAVVAGERAGWIERGRAAIAALDALAISAAAFGAAPLLAAWVQLAG
ncbi:MAG: hypothetical protein IT372_16440 [Polyangiaceae bacterium]|nr:hypothetical protein [Polyangiaceae bacterium]